MRWTPPTRNSYEKPLTPSRLRNSRRCNDTRRTSRRTMLLSRAPSAKKVCPVPIKLSHSNYPRFRGRYSIQATRVTSTSESTLKFFRKMLTSQTVRKFWYIHKVLSSEENATRWGLRTSSRNKDHSIKPIAVLLLLSMTQLFTPLLAVPPTQSKPTDATQSAADRTIAVEHDRFLYVGYSNNGGRRGNLNRGANPRLRLAWIVLDNLGVEMVEFGSLWARRPTWGSKHSCKTRSPRWRPGWPRSFLSSSLRPASSSISKNSASKSATNSHAN